MTMQLYHFDRDRMSNDDLFSAMSGTRNGEGVDLYKRLMDSGAYVLVAEIAGSNLENAWVMTQNGVRTPSWSLEPLEGLTPIGLTENVGFRSSMVGDIVVVDGTMHVVDVVGFCEIGPFEPQPERAPSS